MRESRKAGPGGMIRRDDKGEGWEGKTANSCGQRDWECGGKQRTYSRLAGTRGQARTPGWGSSPLKTNGYKRGNSSFSLLPQTDDDMKLFCAPSLQSMVF